tara:strand:+ start:3063 stop:3593 length:531 start_codon:yes stop_codon:yes gene_type:complete
MAFKGNLSIGHTTFAEANTYNKSNTLDQYEEGRWEAYYADAASGGNSIQNTKFLAAHQYIRIGMKVTVWGYVADPSTTGLTDNNDLFIRGLPYVCSSACFSGVGACVTDYVNFNSGDNSPVAYVEPNEAYLRFYTKDDNLGKVALRVIDIENGNGSDIHYCVTYFTEESNATVNNP